MPLKLCKGLFQLGEIVCDVLSSKLFVTLAQFESLGEVDEATLKSRLTCSVHIAAYAEVPTRDVSMTVADLMELKKCALELQHCSSDLIGGEMQGAKVARVELSESYGVSCASKRLRQSQLTAVPASSYA